MNTYKSYRKIKVMMAKLNIVHVKDGDQLAITTTKKGKNLNLKICEANRKLFFFSVIISTE